MTDRSPINGGAVQALAAAADLPLDAERAAAVAEGLAVWIPAANELNEKMSAPEHRELIPITVFAHRDPEPTE